MPTYEYKRKDGTTFEMKQGINDEALKICPQTGQLVKRLITGGGGVVYKGEGWYVTDYKDNDRKKKAEAEKKTSKKENKSAKKSSSDSKKVNKSSDSE